MSFSLPLHKHSETQRPFSTASLLQMHLPSRPAHPGKINSASPTRASGLYRVLPSVLTGHHAFSCVRGTRESSPAGDCSAGTSSAAFFYSFKNLKYSTEAALKAAAFVIENEKRKC